MLWHCRLPCYSGSEFRSSFRKAVLSLWHYCNTYDVWCWTLWLTLTCTLQRQGVSCLNDGHVKVGAPVVCDRVPNLQSGGCRFKSRPGLLCIEVYSAFHPSRVGKWVPPIAGKAKTGMAHSDCGWTCGCAGKTVKSLENTCHTWALLRWRFTTKRHYIKCMHPFICDSQWHLFCRMTKQIWIKATF